jgi:branched-chain amino acid transport system permease protein
VTGAADIAGLPAGLPKRPASRGLASPLLVGLGLAFACAAPLGLNGYALYLLTLAGIFALVALGLNLLTGYAGQISLCHAAFFGVGAYATALLTTKAGLPYLVSLPVGALLTTAIGAAAAVPALRLKNLYLAIATLGFGVVLYYLTLAFVILGLWGAWNVSRGRTGRALRIIKESEIAAASLGIHIARYKVTAFALSAFYAALAGGLFAYLVRYINPESFNVGLSIAFLSMVVIGGLGTIGGSIVGAAFYVIVPELLRGIKDAPGLVFGLLLVVVMVFMPQGLWGMVRRLGWKR